MKRNVAYFLFGFGASGTCVVAAACGGNSKTNIAQCAAGTSPQDGMCAQSMDGSLADDAGPGADATPDATLDGPSASDARAADTGVDALDDRNGVADSASSDASDASLLDDSGPASMDGGISDGAAYDAEPCPVNSFTQEYGLNCDPNCAAEQPVASVCATATCAGGSSYSPGAPLIRCGLTQIVRTPPAPGVDPQCAADCPSQEWTAGLAMSFASSFNTAYSVTVDPPWQLIKSASGPFCPTQVDAGAVNCLWFDGTTAENIFAVTTDPSAPARDISIQCAAQDPCP